MLHAGAPAEAGRLAPVRLRRAQMMRRGRSRREGSGFHYVRVEPAGALPNLSQRAPFKAVFASDAPIDDTRRLAICRWLVEEGCRYLVLYGSDCDTWCRSLREANLEVFDLDTMDPTNFVMTTGHPHESLRAVLWFAKKSARHPDIEFTEVVMLHVSHSDRSAQFHALFEKA